MATVDEQLARYIIASDGFYSVDPRVLQVVSYTDMGGKQAWAILYERDVLADRYAETEFVREPKVEWAAPVEQTGFVLCRPDKTPVKYGDTADLNSGGQHRIVGAKRGLTSAGFVTLVRAVPVGWDWNDGVRLNLSEASSFGLTWEQIV